MIRNESKRYKPGNADGETTGGGGRGGEGAEKRLAQRTSAWALAG